MGGSIKAARANLKGIVWSDTSSAFQACAINLQSDSKIDNCQFLNIMVRDRSLLPSLFVFMLWGVLRAQGTTAGSMILHNGELNITNSIIKMDQVGRLSCNATVLRLHVAFLSTVRMIL